jgi:hypothetical protein
MKYIITAFTLMSLTHPVYADEIKPVPLNGFQEAAIFGIDRAICKLPVPQSAIDGKIIKGMLEMGVNTYEDGVKVTTYYFERAILSLDESKTANQYCDWRKGM